jgi:hypothetical protein
MSDYLGNLAAKSLAPAPALQPRLASRFEPLAPAAPELREGPAFLEETVTEIAAPKASPVRTEIRPAHRDPAPADVQSVEPSPPGLLSPRERRNVIKEKQELAVEPVTKPERVRSVVAKRNVQPSETSPPGPLSRKEGRDLAEAAVVNRDRLQPLTVVPAPSRQDVPVTPSRERGPGGEASQAERPEHHRPQESLSRMIPQLQPRVTLAERQPFVPQRESPAPEPVIHVTIGRIEVRAAAAPKAPARERPAARPAVDLDEYLRQRSKGEGR